MPQSGTNVLKLLELKGISPLKRATTQGGEYHSPCPGCAGTDRFHVWPAQNEGCGSYWCRQCGKGGDNIQFLIDFDGLSYPEACARLEIEPEKRQPFRAPSVPSRSAAGHRSSYEPASKPETTAPNKIWMEKAAKLVAWAHETLLKNRRQVNWLKKRGIDKDAIIKYRLGWISEDLWRPRTSWGLEKILKDNGKPKMLWIPGGLVVPKMSGEDVARIRIRRPEGKPKYYVLPGSSMEMMAAGGDGRASVIVESELDMIMIDGLAGDIVCCVALGTSAAKRDQAAVTIIKSAAVVLNALDFDAAGAKELKWWTENVPDIKRWPVPVGKDPGDAFRVGIDIREWLIAGLPQSWFIGPSVLESNVEREPGGEDDQGPPGVGGEVPESVMKLHRLLKQAPVAILNRYDRLKLLENKDWARRNWELSKQISQFVYMDPDVFRYLAAHPDEKISAKNLIYERSAGTP